MLYYILFFALRVSSAAKQTCKIYHRQILYIIAVIVIFFLRFIGFNIIHLLYQSTLCFLIPAIFFLQVAPNFSVKRS